MRATTSSSALLLCLLIAVSVVASAGAFRPVSISSLVGQSTKNRRPPQGRPAVVPSSKPTTTQRGKISISLKSSAVPLEPDAASKKQAAAAAAAASSTVTTQQQQVDLVTRSSVAALSCVTTWAIATFIPGMNIITASSLQGLVACAIPGRLIPGPVCAASFCGSFAGMSAQAGSSLGEISLLGVLCGIVYYIFERPQRKLQLGKGGRLGTIAFLANVLYFGIRQGSSQFGTLIVDIVNLLRPSTTVAVLAAATMLNTARSRSLVVAQKQQESGDSNGAAAAGVVVPKILSTVSKGAIIAALGARLLETTGTSTATALIPLVKSTLAMFAASLAVRKSTPVVLPVALIGLLGGLFGGSMAAPLYLGAFIGMTGLKEFTTSKFLQASVVSSLLLQLGLFTGFGGKLGFLAFIGVNFGL